MSTFHGTGRREAVAITGATAGVGRATVRRFARDGACLALLAREPGRPGATRTEADVLGAAVVTVAGDVAAPAATKELARAAEATHCAAHHRRREMHVGVATARAINGRSRK